VATTKAQDELLRHVLAGRTGALADELAAWLSTNRRFEAVVAAHRDKIRKKLRSAVDETAGADVRAELLVAYRLVTERRFHVAFENYGSGNRGPDLTVTFRINQPFNVEVTRLRVGRLAGGDETGASSRLAGVLLTKLRQLPAGVPNVVALVCGESPDAPTPVTTADVAAAVKLLKTHADRKEEAVFTRRGYESARHFYTHYVRLSAAAIVHDTTITPSDATTLWTNPEARHPLPRDAAAALARSILG